MKERLFWLVRNQGDKRRSINLLDLLRTVAGLRAHNSADVYDLIFLASLRFPFLDLGA